MASETVDPLQALSAALAVPSDSKEQADLLAKLRESLEAHPSPIPILCTTLIKTVSGAGDSLLKRWVLDLLHFAICRSNLSLEARTQCACSICVLLKMVVINGPWYIQWLHNPWRSSLVCSATQTRTPSRSWCNASPPCIPCCSERCEYWYFVGLLKDRSRAGSSCQMYESEPEISMGYPRPV